MVNRDRLLLKQKGFKAEKTAGLLMIALPMLGFLLFSLIPILISFALSFVTLHSYDLSEAIPNGFKNFAFIFKDTRFWHSIKNTLFFSLNMPICLILSLLIATLLDKIKVL